MKSSCTLLLYLCFCSSSVSIYAQVLWSEDFESYTVGTGYVGSTSPTAALVSGDYPSLVTKWTIDTSAAKLTATSDWLAVQEDELGNKVFELRDADGEFVWSSEIVSITGYLEVVLGLSITEVSNLESTDYINVYYKLDGAEEVLFETNGTNSNDFSISKPIQTGLVGSTIQIIIRAKNNSSLEQIRFDDVFITEKSLLITEVSSPSDNGLASFIELKNSSNHSINFDTQDYYVSVQTDGNLWNETQLQGSLCAGCIHLIAQSSSVFNTAYNFIPPEENTIINGNGNDAYFIFYNGNHSTGSVVDVYGIIDENGLGQTWNYENSKAVRNTNVALGTPFWQASEWTISTATTSDMSPGALENELRYFNSAWCPNAAAPTTLSNDIDIIIQKGAVVISEAIECLSLTIFTNASLEISAGIGITVSGNCTNNGVLNVQSNETNNGSFIVNGTMTNTFNYNLYLTGGASNPWHLIAAPVQSQSLNSFVTNGENSIQTSASNNYGLAVFNTATEFWNYFHNGSGFSPNLEAYTAGSFEDAKGYSVLRSSSGIVSFSGEMNTTDQSTSLTASKWNLLGNPYPSFINGTSSASLNNILSNNTSALNDNYEALYLWNVSTSEYNIVNQSSGAIYLSPGQGFYVLSEADAGDFSFTESMQSHQTGDWFERSTGLSSIKILAMASNGTSSTEIKFINNTSTSFDVGYDAARFDAVESDFYIFSQVVDGSNTNLELGVQCIPFSNSADVDVIPIVLFTETPTEVVFNFELNQLTNSTKVFFKDQLLDTIIEVNSNTAYAFSTDLQYSLDRFTLLVNDSLSEVTIEDIAQNNIELIISDQKLSILGLKGIAKFKIYNLLGKELISDSFYGNSYDVSSLLSGVYIISLEYKNEIINQMVKL